jgi:hypothetical protein
MLQDLVWHAQVSEQKDSRPVPLDRSERANARDEWSVEKRNVYLILHPESATNLEAG